MDPITAAVGSGLVKGIGSLLGDSAERKARDMANNAIDAAIAELQAAGVPPAEALNVAYERFSQSGKLTPEMQQAFQLKGSELQDVNADPELRSRRMNALDQLTELGTLGMTDAEKADRESLLMDAQNESMSAMNTLQAKQAAQGQQGSSGTNLALQAMAAQGAGANASANARDLSKQISQRALQSIIQSGDMAGKLESDTLGLAERKAQAADMINKYNTSNQQNVAGANVGTRNQAQQYNLGVSQDISNRNTGLSNAERDVARQNKINEQNAQAAQAAKIAAYKAQKGQTSANAERAQAGVGSALLNAAGTGLGAFTETETANQKYATAPAEDDILTKLINSRQSGRNTVKFQP